MGQQGFVEMYFVNFLVTWHFGVGKIERKRKWKTHDITNELALVLPGFFPFHLKKRAHLSTLARRFRRVDGPPRAALLVVVWMIRTHTPPCWPTLPSPLLAEHTVPLARSTHTRYAFTERRSIAWIARRSLGSSSPDHHVRRRRNPAGQAPDAVFGCGARGPGAAPIPHGLHQPARAKRGPSLIMGWLVG